MNIAAGNALFATQLQQNLRSGAFVVTTEVSPPVSADLAEFLAKAAPLKGLATAVNVTDGAGAKTHLSTLVAAHFLLQNGIEPILQMTCRDRNRLALQADLIGAMALGIRNVLILSGDNPKVGDQPEAKAVGDLDSKALLATAHLMRAEHKLPPGTEIKGNTALVLGAADMPIDPPPEWNPTSLLGKVDAGADFAQTQFCMDMGIARRYAKRLLDLGIAQRLPILIGVCPIPSGKSARWMKEKLFGTIIPDYIVERLDNAADAREEGKKICVEILRELATIPGIAGAHIMAPVNPSVVPEVIATAAVTGLKRALV
ncbi:MAG: methylenetetrahydrofolate reductase [Burkholderiales bacterium]